MEDSDKKLESFELMNENNRTLGSKATGRIDLRYTKADGAIQKWSLIRFDLVTQHDAHKHTWISTGKAYSTTHAYEMQLRYTESDQILTISLQNYVFTVPRTHMHVAIFNNKSTLKIGFLKDAKGSTHSVGDQYVIMGNSHLNLSL